MGRHWWGIYQVSLKSGLKNGEWSRDRSQRSLEVGSMALCSEGCQRCQARDQGSADTKGGEDPESPETLELAGCFLGVSRPSVMEY